MLGVSFFFKSRLYTVPIKSISFYFVTNLICAFTHSDLIFPHFTLSYRNISFEISLKKTFYKFSVCLDCTLSEKFIKKRLKHKNKLRPSTHLTINLSIIEERLAGIE